MSEQVEAMKELLGEVVAGETNWSAHLIKKALGGHHQLNVLNAQNGSLDAAKSLHEALLPKMGWDVCERSRYPNLLPSRFNGRYLAKVGWGMVTYADSDCPARAWLIAILKARLFEMEVAS